MPVRRRRRHEHTLRFKPDLWGRETESGTVLFDGVVNLDENGKGQIELARPLQVLHNVTITFDGLTMTGEVREDNGVGISTGYEDTHVEIYENGASYTIRATRYDEASDEDAPITGNVNLTVNDDGMIPLNTVFEGVLPLSEMTQQGQTAMVGYAEGNPPTGEVIVGYFFIDGELVGPIGDPIQKDGYTYQCMYVESMSKYGFVTTNMSMTSVNLRIALRTAPESESESSDPVA